MTLAAIRAFRQSLPPLTQCTQSDIEAWDVQLSPFRHILNPKEKEERFRLVDAQGKDLPLTAPRWLSHVLGLRHRAIHILLSWQRPPKEEMYVLQVRHWDKSDGAGHLDISVGGHLNVAGGNHLTTAYRELEEELGLRPQDLKTTLRYWGGHAMEHGGENPFFLNLEWCELFTAELTGEGLAQIHFTDQEVVGLYLCPKSGIDALLRQSILPLSGALIHSLPLLLEENPI